jgi:hypothetical protein
MQGCGIGVSGPAFGPDGRPHSGRTAHGSHASQGSRVCGWCGWWCPGWVGPACAPPDATRQGDPRPRSPASPPSPSRPPQQGVYGFRLLRQPRSRDPRRRRTDGRRRTDARGRSARTRAHDAPPMRRRTTRGIRRRRPASAEQSGPRDPVEAHLLRTRTRTPGVGHARIYGFRLLRQPRSRDPRRRRTDARGRPARTRAHDAPPMPPEGRPARTRAHIAPAVRRAGATAARPRRRSRRWRGRR